MEKTNLMDVAKGLAAVAVVGLMFFAVHSFYGAEKAAPTPVKRMLAQDTTLNIKFKSTRGYTKPKDSTDLTLGDKGCEAAHMDLIVLDENEIHLVFNSENLIITEKFIKLAVNPDRPNQLLVMDSYGKRMLMTLLCMEETEDENHKHWFVIEDEESFRVYSTQEGECEFLKSGN